MHTLMEFALIHFLKASRQTLTGLTGFGGETQKQSRFKSCKSCHLSVNACSSTHYPRIQTSAEKSQKYSFFVLNKRGMKTREKKQRETERLLK